QRRVVEMCGRTAANSKPFHDCWRAMGRRRRVRSDFAKRDSPNPVGKGQSGRLGCITASPMLEGQTPAYLDTGCEMGSEPLDRQSGKPDEGCYTWNLDRPQAKTMLVEMPLDAIDHRVTLNVTERAPEE